ncbi:MAG: DUF1934 domain-containing protein [Clostridiaceae bacterium]|nr:DUF1934 domain-containing protein [Clostridiaceae bacterium]
MLIPADIDRDAVIYVESSQWADGEQYDPVRLMTHGHFSYEQEQDVWNVSYDESDATGMRGTHTRVSLYPNGRIVLSRTGEIEMELEFIKGGQRVEQKYTPFGTMRLSVLTHEVKGSFTEEGGALEIGYSLGFDNRHAISTNLQLEVTANQPTEYLEHRTPLSGGKHTN